MRPQESLGDVLMSVTVESNMQQASASIKQRASVGLRRAVEDVFTISRPKTPQKTGDLRNRTRKQVLGLSGLAAWDVNYAVYPERGYGSGLMVNWTTAGTGPHFAESAVKTVASQPSKYFTL